MSVVILESLQTIKDAVKAKDKALRRNMTAKAEVTCAQNHLREAERRYAIASRRLDENLNKLLAELQEPSSS